MRYSCQFLCVGLLLTIVPIAVLATGIATFAEPPYSPTASVSNSPGRTQPPIQDNTGPAMGVLQVHIFLTNGDLDYLCHRFGWSLFQLYCAFFLYGALCGAIALISPFRAYRRRVTEEVDRQLTEAIALSIKTDNFSEEARQTAAAAQRDQVLSNHAKIEAKEAQRICNVKARMAYYERVARHAARQSELSHAAILAILRKADEWEYAVLQEAKRLATELSR